MKKFLLSFLCFLLAVAGGYAEVVTDVLNRSTTGITNTTYASWTVKDLNSAAVYEGQSAGGNSSIQLRSDKSTSGIITTTSGGKVMKIVVEWNSSTSSGRTLDVYGKNTAYSSPADLYNSSKQGTKLGSIKYGTSTELTITGDYAFIGLRSNSGAMYLSRIEITWENGETGGEETPVAPSAPTLTPSCSFYYTMDVGITNIPDGSTIYYTTDGTDPSSNDAKYTAPFKITETTTVKAIAVNEVGSSEVVSAAYTKIEVPEGQVIDILNRDLTGNTTTGYSEWSGKTSNSSAVYAGQSAGGNSSIQLRSTSPSGIVTTTSGGKVKKVIVEWESNTQNGRTLNVYGKNTAYTSPADLYNTSTDGDLLGTIVYGTSTELEVKGDYAYIGLRSNSGAMYLTSVSITWDTSASVEPETPVAPNAPTLTASCNFDDAMNVVITNISEGATVYYTTDGSTPSASASNSTVYSKPFEITATTTVNAIAVNDGGSSEVVTATYTKNQVLDSGVTDILTRETTGVESGSTTYTDWSDKKSNSSAVYAGQSASKDGTIQLRSKNSNSGIVSTTSGGKVRKITVEWNSQTTENQVLQIYGNNSPYTSAAELYNTNNNTNQGKLLGEIVCGESTIFVEENYAYVGLRSKNGAIYLNSVEITWEEDVWGSLYYPTDVEIPTSVKAYIVTAANNNYVTLTQVTGALPANTGIIYNGKWTEKGSAVSDEANVEGNLLEGTVDATNISKEAYVLAKVDGEVGFYKAQMNKDEGTAFLNNANKAYLPVDKLPSSVQNAKALKFDFNTTAVENVEVETEGKKVIYDLSGRRVNEMAQPGIYIVNGKKVMVKYH